MFSERFQILISPDQRRRLEGEAKRRGTSVAALIREAVDLYVGAPARRERLDAIAGLRAMRGRLLLPEELERLVQEERTGAADA
jgi:hypothetical protein